MKTIITLLVLGGLVLGGIYFFGGYRSFDPNKQGQEAKAAIKPGMTLKQVIKVGGNNPKYAAINVFPVKVGKETVEEERIGTPVAFDYNRVADHVKKKEVKHGFVLSYVYSGSIAFDVRFDGDGKVIDVTDQVTVSKLLGY